MNSIARLFVCFCVSVVVMRCARVDNFAHTSALPPAKPVFVVSSGYFSCKMPWSQPTDSVTFTSFKPNLAAAGEAPTYFASCFNLTNDSFWYQTDAQSSVISASPTQYYDLVAERVAAAGPGAEIIMVGHSWGAALEIANAVQLSALAPVAYLATLDPISVTDCPPSIVAEAIVGGDPTDTDPACTQAPPDLASVFPDVAAHAARWDHFYQETFDDLHSGPIPQATTSTLETYPQLTALTDWEAHQDVDADPRIWASIATNLVK